MSTVLILTNANDYSSSAVIKWLIYLNKSFTRINNGDTLQIKNLKINDHNICFYLNGKYHELKNYSSYWYRRGNFNIQGMPPYSSDDIFLQEKINRHLNRERKAIKNFIHALLDKKRNINSELKAEVNKLEVLQIAKDIGLVIPETHVISQKKTLNALLNTNKIITKSIQENPSFQYNDGTGNELFYSMTESINKTHLKLVGNEFALSKFQTKIDKALELRVFFLNHTFHAMAIFSQNNPKTSVDFRNYDQHKPNRNTPFLLPKNIEIKLNLLCKKLNLNSGSIDMVIDKKGNYVFLEINPVGQFGMVSSPCNYYLEKKIAKYL
jgi:ATP-GRASP peptide maturase of grasp-with-spasm system